MLIHEKVENIDAWIRMWGVSLENLLQNVFGKVK